jgi:hypothetical protein
VQLTEGSENVRKAVLAIVVIVIGSLVVMQPVKLYYIRDDDSDATLLWRGDEGYLFIGTNRRGWSGNYVWWLEGTLEEFLGGVIPPRAAKPSVVVLRVTPQEVKRYVAEGLEPGICTPFEKTIYYGYSNGFLWKWTGMRFEKATAEEQQRFDSARSGDGSWSETTKVLSRADNEPRFTVELSGKPLVLVARRSGFKRTIELQLPNREPQTIWSLDRHPRRATKAEHQQVFGE